MVLKSKIVESCGVDHFNLSSQSMNLQDIFLAIPLLLDGQCVIPRVEKYSLN